MLLVAMITITAVVIIYELKKDDYLTSSKWVKVYCSNPSEEKKKYKKAIAHYNCVYVKVGKK